MIVRLPVIKITYHVDLSRQRMKETEQGGTVSQIIGAEHRYALSGEIRVRYILTRLDEGLNLFIKIPYPSYRFIRPYRVDLAITDDRPDLFTQMLSITSFVLFPGALFTGAIGELKTKVVSL